MYAKLLVKAVCARTIAWCLFILKCSISETEFDSLSFIFSSKSGNPGASMVFNNPYVAFDGCVMTTLLFNYLQDIILLPTFS